MATIGDLLERAGHAYEALTAVGEEIDDEWQYITDLTAAWQAEFERVAASRADQAVEAAIEAAIDWIVDEIGRISDPHRALDWLSTFPQVVLLALDRPA